MIDLPSAISTEIQLAYAVMSDRMADDYSENLVSRYLCGEIDENGDLVEDWPR